MTSQNSAKSQQLTKPAMHCVDENQKKHVEYKVLSKLLKTMYSVFFSCLRYRVIYKEVSRKTEEKMLEKMKVILQKDENLEHV